ncbi:MAG: YcgN family cysteine cluster protein [Rhodospirillales bacterium]|nr:YcgN family cysteine cluster protein [Rhodospirillales bacterium]
MADKRPYWERKSLVEMTEAEWEGLCDGCGRCCSIKLEDAETGQIDDTDVACKLFDARRCCCRDYANRQRRVPDCVKLTPDKASQIAWMPRSCAYRLLAEGEKLYWWHPLVSGDPESVHAAGISVRGRVVDERNVPDAELQDHIVYWPHPDEPA